MLTVPSIPIRPANCQVTGCKHRFMGDDYDTFFYDTRLPFGAKSSPEIFHRITQAVRRMMARRGFPNIVVYLDDFLVFGATRADCERAYNILVTLLQDLWFRISKQKLVPNTQRPVFPGVQLDTISSTMTLLQDKLTDLQAVLCCFQTKRRATKTQLQWLAGKLHWACRVVYGGRTFPRRILDTLNCMSPTAKHIDITLVFCDISSPSSSLLFIHGKNIRQNEYAIS